MLKTLKISQFARVSRECRESVAIFPRLEQRNRGTEEQRESKKNSSSNDEDSLSGKTQKTSDPKKAARKQSSLPAHTLPADWTPNTSNRRFAEERGIDCDNLAEIFRNWCKSKNLKSRDFDSEFNNWIRRERLPAQNRSMLSKSVLNDLANENLQRQAEALDRLEETQQEEET